MIDPQPSSPFPFLEIHLGKQLDLEAACARLVDLGYQPVAALGMAGEFTRRGGLLDIFPGNFEAPIRVELDGDDVASLTQFNPITGDRLGEHQAVMIMPANYALRTPGEDGVIDDETPIDHFLDIDAGDYVVHVRHGIGQYLGIRSLLHDGRHVDHLEIEYAHKARLFVPCDQIHLVQKYISLNGRRPRLYRLGSRQWQRVKQRVQRGAYRYAQDLLELEAARRVQSGYAFDSDTEWQQEFEARFPYTETKDQAQSTADVKRDMESSKPMDRLLMGDVGYGKTEVALRAAFKAVMSHRQVAMLVPTTILAEQHAVTFRNRLQAYPIRVEMLSRFRTRREQHEVVQGLRDGAVDVVIGTHRLLSKDVEFRDLGLVIIDEEQRFGVRHKDRLKQLRLEVDVLTLTATPIPRTLYLTLAGARDMSAINTPPKDRLPIDTFVGTLDERLLQQALRRELERQGQVYVVMHRIRGLRGFSDRLQRLVPTARIAVAHGRLPSRQLERVMQEFMQGAIDVLVCTTIIESGIDIPNANTLIVYPANQFGLADLYQLRGRVGRFRERAHAYFLLPEGAVPTTDAQRRLDAIRRFTELGAGFKIALEDLQIRGAGNLLGTEQHGQVSAVGFDLYCRLLRSAVQHLKQREEHRIGPALQSSRDDWQTGVWAPQS